MTDTWRGGAGNWGTGSQWSNGAAPVSPDAAAASSGTVTIVSGEYESVGGLSFSGSAGLVIDGGLAVGQGSPPGNPTINFALGTPGAVVEGYYTNLTIGQYINGTASGTVHLKGSGTSLYWQATQAASSGLVVDFADNGSSAFFNVEAPFAGTVQGFQAGDSITDNYGTGNATYSFGNNAVTVTRGGRSVTVRFSGGTYNAGNLSVDASTGKITTTYVTSAPQVGSATYDASTGRMVINRATGVGTAPFTTDVGDFDPTQIYLRGQGSTSYQLTGGTVSAVSGDACTVTLTAADKLQIDGLLDNDGTRSADHTSYVVRGGASFDRGGKVSADCRITVSNALNPTVSAASYDPSTHVLTLTGSGLADAGGYGSLNLGQFSISSGSARYTFDVDSYAGVVSETQAVIDLSNTAFTNQQSITETDSSSVEALFRQAGPYTISASRGWEYGAGAPFVVQNVTVPGAAPTITSGSSNPPAGSDIRAGQTVTFSLNFSDAVAVTGTPTLTLTGGRTAAFSTVSGTTATFSYVVRAGDDMSDLMATAIGTPNGATIRSSSGDADLSSFRTIDTGIRIDTTAPAATSLTRTTSTGASDLRAGASVTFTLGAGEALTVGPDATLTLSNGATATYLDGSGTAAPRFIYTVAAGQDTSDLGVTGYAGSIADGAGNALAASGVVEDTGIRIDTTAPAATSLTRTTSTGTSDLRAGASVTFTLGAGEALTVGPSATLTLSNGATATYLDGSGTAAPRFIYTVAAGQDTSDLGVTGYAGSIADGAGNALAASGVVEDTGIRIDTTAPAATSLTLLVAQNAGATAIGLPAPAEAGGSSVAIAAGALPDDGTVALASGGAVVSGQALSPADLTGLTFTPTAGAFGTSSNFTYSVTDAAGNVGTGTATLAVGGPGTPSIQGMAGPLSTAGERPLSPFAAATVSDPNAGADDVVTITLSGQGGTLQDGGGRSGLSRTGPASYSLAADTPAAVTAELQALVFTPSYGGSNVRTTTGFSLGVASSAGPSSPTPVTTSVVNTDRRIGRAVDGYLAGATVFEDDNDNGVLDPGEASTVTASDGSYDLPYDQAPLVAIDGTDTSTGIPNTTTLTAPAGATVVSPLTTLVGAVAAQNGGDVAAAQGRILSALGLSADTDLLSLDPVAAASSGTAQGRAAYVAAAQAQDTVVLLSAAGSTSGYASLATAIARSSGLLDLTSGATLAAIGAQAGLSGSILASAVARAQSSNASLANGALAASTPSALLAAIAGAQALAQGTDAPALAAERARRDVVPAPPEAAAGPAASTSDPAPAGPSAPPLDRITVDQDVGRTARGSFTIRGEVSSSVGVAGVELSAFIDGDPNRPVDLGAATVNADGTFTFDDVVGRSLQGFITATETDAAGRKLQADFHPAIQGGSVPSLDRYLVTPDGALYLGSTFYRPDGSHRVTVAEPGQTLKSDHRDTFQNGGVADTTFVFDPGYGHDVVSLFRHHGAGHDTLSFKGADFGDSVAALLRDTHDAKGGAVIVDPTSGDTVKLMGISKAQLTANQADIAFHA